MLSDLGDSIAAPQLKELEHAAHSLGVDLLVRDIRTADDLPADSLGLGRSPGVGWKQTLGAVVGVLVVVVGAYLLRRGKVSP